MDVDLYGITEISADGEVEIHDASLGVVDIISEFALGATADHVEVTLPKQ